jgi:hypothetical protein
MSTDYPPPQQPAPDQNPYTKQPDGAPPQPPPSPYDQSQQPFGYPPPAQSGPYGQPPDSGQQPGSIHPTPPTSRPGLGILVGFVTALAAALVHGWIIGYSNEDVSYAAISIGLGVGAVVGKVGGHSPVMPYAGLVLTLLSVFLSQFLGEAFLSADVTGFSVTTVLTDYTHDIFQFWKDDLGFMRVLYIVIAGVAGFMTPRHING